jgi:hypothetical protein
MANTGIADVSATIETVISALTTRTLIQESVALAMPGVWDRSGEVRPGMDTLDMIELASLAIQTVDETGASLTPTTLSPASASLDLDQHKGIFFALTKRGDLQSKIALVQRTVENGVRELAAGIDDYIFAQAVAAAGTSETTAGADALADILGCKEQMDTDNVPKSGRAIAASPVFMSSLLSSNTVVQANTYGSTDPVRMGRVAQVFGFDIFESSSASIAADGFVAMGLEAMAFARQRSISFEEQNQVLGQKKDYSLVHLFGAATTKASNPRIYNFDPA